MRSLPRLREFVKATDAPNRTLTVVDGTAPESVTNLLASAFDDQPVGVERVAAPDRDGSQVALVEDRSVVATSSLDELLDTYLLVNTDSYRPGTAPVESVEMPTVLAALSETRFHLRGYPASNKEKLLLVVLSRHIERLALEADGGTLRSLFQRLSRIDDERETLRVYERLAGSSVDTHVYGVPDHGAPPGRVDCPRRNHTGLSTHLVRRVHPGGAGNPAAMLSIAAGDNEWDGYWTFDPRRVAAIDAAVADE